MGAVFDGGLSELFEGVRSGSRVLYCRAGTGTRRGWGDRPNQPGRPNQGPGSVNSGHRLPGFQSPQQISLA